MTTPRLMSDPRAIQDYVLAGHATITLRSTKSGQHYTYKVRAAQDRPDMYFVSLLHDQDQYCYIGMIIGGAFRLTRASKMLPESGPVRAFGWFLGRWQAPDLEVRHEGTCGRCGRELTHPESIDRGIGPDCWEALGHAA